MIKEAINMTELYHHGVKGQKWGVRRYQNKDGSLTAKGIKRQNKMDSYRNKLADKAAKKSKRHNSEYEDAMYNVKDLKRNGTNSKAYRDWKDSIDSDRAYEYERRNSINLNGNNYTKSYRSSGERFANDFLDGISSDRTISNLINDNSYEAKKQKDMAKRWATSNKNLMNMEVSALTTKKDIKKVYKG